MADRSVSRRIVVGALAGGLVGAQVSTMSLAPDANGASKTLAGAQPIPAERRLLSPLAAGSQLLAWEVIAIEPLELGAVRVELRGGEGVAFRIEVLARDASPLALKPPAETERFALYVSNGGDGRMATVEQQGLAAMALAQIVAANEPHLSSEGFLTHRERIAEHPVALLRHMERTTLPGPLDPASGSAPPSPRARA